MKPVEFTCLLTCLFVFAALLVVSTYIYLVDYHRYRKRMSGRDAAASFQNRCNAGECVTDITTGLKRCPADAVPEVYDPTAEVCNPRYSCTSPLTQFPVGVNGATLMGHNCPDGLACDCSSKPRCQSDIATVLMVSDNLRDPRVLVAKNDVESTKLPVGYRLLCHIPHDLSMKSLGCKVGSKKDTYDCMSGGKAAVVCPYGTAAVALRSGRLHSTPVRAYCVYARPCPADSVLHYDSNTTQSLCLKQNEWGTGI